MINTEASKNYRATEYLLLVCILFLKVWCGFINQAVLFAVGGVISGVVDFAICIYIFTNTKRVFKETNRENKLNTFLLVFFFFAMIYCLIFSIGYEYLPRVSVLGLFAFPKQIYNMAFAVVYLSTLVLAVNNLHENERKIVSKVLLIIFSMVAFANLVAVMINPSLVKNDAYNEGASIFTLGYTGSYNLMLITPIILYKLGESKKKLLYAMIIVCNLASIFYGGYFIAILGTIVALLMYWILSIRNKFFVVFFGVILVGSIVSLIMSGALESIMWYLSDTIEIDVISGRCRDIARYLSGRTNVNEGDTTFRIYIYQDTFEEFLNHPIIGNYAFGNFDCQWDHSTLLDLLSVGGIFLGGLFLTVVIMGYRFASSFMKSERAKRTLLAAVVSYLFVALINSAITYSYLGILFSVAPIVMGGESENENTDSSSL